MNRSLKRALVPVGGVLTAALLVPAPGAGKGAPKCPPKCPTAKGDLTATASPNLVRFGLGTTVSGKLKGDRGGTAITLQADEFPLEGNFGDIAQAATKNNGDYTFGGVRPAALTRYRVRANTSPAVTSGSVSVQVAISVRLHLSDSSPSRGQRVTFSGTAKPEHDGNLVRVQRRLSKGTYKTVKQTVLTDNGTASSAYSTRVRVSVSGLYRVKVSGDANHVSGVKKRTIDVHG